MAKLTARDKKILELQKEIQEQRTALESVAKKSYKTNLVLPIGGNRINLNTLDRDTILVYIAQLASIKPSLLVLGITDEPDLGGYHIEDWIHDLRNKYVQLNKREEEIRLNLLEHQLETILSEDVKKDKELEQVMKNMGKK